MIEIDKDLVEFAKSATFCGMSIREMDNERLLHIIGHLIKTQEQDRKHEKETRNFLFGMMKIKRRWI